MRIYLPYSTPLRPERETAPAHALAASGIRPGIRPRAGGEARWERTLVPFALPFPASLLHALGIRR